MLARQRGALAAPGRFVSASTSWRSPVSRASFACAIGAAALQRAGWRRDGLRSVWPARPSPPRRTGRRRPRRSAREAAQRAGRSGRHVALGVGQVVEQPAVGVGDALHLLQRLRARPRCSSRSASRPPGRARRCGTSPPAAPWRPARTRAWLVLQRRQPQVRPPRARLRSSASRRRAGASSLLQLVQPAAQLARAGRARRRISAVSSLDRGLRARARPPACARAARGPRAAAGRRAACARRRTAPRVPAPWARSQAATTAEQDRESRQHDAPMPLRHAVSGSCRRPRPRSLPMVYTTCNSSSAFGLQMPTKPPGG